MELERSPGAMLHPTSLPSPYGIGDIGPAAHGWIDFLADTGTQYWQALPLTHRTTA
jgi:4-alpha-glucanotransferase